MIRPGSDAQLLKFKKKNLLAFLTLEVPSIYDSNTLSSMDYFLVGREWCKKESMKAKIDFPKVSKTITNFVFVVLKDIEEVKENLRGLEEGLVKL